MQRCCEALSDRIRPRFPESAISPRGWRCPACAYERERRQDPGGREPVTIRLQAADASRPRKVVVATVVEDVLEDPDAADDAAGSEVSEVGDHEHPDEVRDDPHAGTPLDLRSGRVEAEQVHELAIACRLPEHDVDRYVADMYPPADGRLSTGRRDHRPGVKAGTWRGRCQQRGQRGIRRRPPVESHVDRDYRGQRVARERERAEWHVSGPGKRRPTLGPRRAMGAGVIGTAWGRRSIATRGRCAPPPRSPRVYR